MDLSLITANALEMVNEFLAQLPNIIVGLVVFIIFLFVARGVEGLVKRATNRISAQGAVAIGRIAKWVTVLLGAFIALTIIFPSVDVAALLGVLGVTSVAIGFAFQDVLQNFFAGLILLLTEPFKIGDQIKVGDYEGTVKQIETRATTIHTYDGRDALIPNAKLFIESVLVNTAHEKRRSQYDIGIGYGDDIMLAKRLMVEAMEEIHEIIDEPRPEALLVELGDFAVIIRARWWTRSQRADVVDLTDKVLTAIAAKLTDNGIDMPFPTQQILFHDQTEETDGDRTRQREGWPVPRQGEAPRPRRIVDALAEMTAERMNGGR